MTILPYSISNDMADTILTTAKNTLILESQAILDILPHINESMVKAVHLLLNCTGRVVVSGMGKSGHIARKIAATLASTGTCAFFVHPAEAAHGDLGMLHYNDVFIALSNSGNTEELINILPSLRQFNIPIIAITSDVNALLSQYASVHLQVKVQQEACPLLLAPTASTTAALAMGDALAMATLAVRKFTTEDFAKSHPGGALGRKLLTHVRDIMRTKEAIPMVNKHCSMLDALIEITQKGIGMTAIIDHESGQLVGIFTDGDIRRFIEQFGDIRSYTVEQGMSRNPLTISANTMAIDALKLMNDTGKNQLLVIDDTSIDCPLVGALHIHDLIKAKII